MYVRLEGHLNFKKVISFATGRVERRLCFVCLSIWELSTFRTTESIEERAKP